MNSIPDPAQRELPHEAAAASTASEGRRRQSLVGARLRKHADYQRAYTAARKRQSASMSWFLAPQASAGEADIRAHARVGLTAGKVLGKAHDRNRIKRRMRKLVGTASNGLEALEMLQMDPDVVTMDLTMPQMDGIECISKLVVMKPAVRILVISALADKATAVEAMEKGANGFLNKPFTDRQLNEAIADLMR